VTAPAEDPRGGEAKHAGIVREATDLCWKATPFTEDETGAVAAYLLPAGVVHRLLGQLQGAGYPAAFRAIAAPPAAGRGDTDSGGEACADCSRISGGVCCVPENCAAHAAGDRAQPTPWTPADGDSRCQQCGNPNPVWRAPHRVWNAVVGGDPDREAGGVLCPTCFLALPALAALLDAQAAVSRVRDLTDHMLHNGAYDGGTVQVIRRALDGTT
jgi:hypothetical protein